MSKANDPNEHARQVNLAQRGISTSDYRNQEKLRRIEYQARERAATHEAARQAASYTPWSASNSHERRPKPKESGCFADGTRVLTPEGYRPIESIAAGEFVLTQPLSGGTAVARRVIRTKRVTRVRIWEVRLSGGADAVIATTAFHAFRTDRGWVMARRLRPGDRLMSLGSSAVFVTGIRKTVRVEAVSNLVVAGYFNYIVEGCVVDSLGVLRSLKSLWYNAWGILRRLHVRGIDLCATPSSSSLSQLPPV